jgi:hypothetical protein
MSNIPARTFLGHGAGTANASLNNNKTHAQVASNNSLFNWKTAAYEVHVHENQSNLASKALMVGTGVAVGAAVLWGAGQMFSTQKSAVEETSERDGEGHQGRVIEERTTTTVSANVRLEAARNTRRRLA